MISKAVPICFLCLFTRAVGSWSPFGCSEALAWRVLCMVAKHDWKASTDPRVTASEFVGFLLQNGPVINLERSLKAYALIHTATQVCSLSARLDHLWPESLTLHLLWWAFFFSFFLLPVSLFPAALFCPRALHDAPLNWHHAWGPPSAGIFMLELITPRSSCGPQHRTTDVFIL